MERRKARGSTDELALVKAAAWAWYQRGSGSDSRSMREYNVTRNERAPKPSRYKLEAIREVQEPIGVSCSATPPSPLSSPIHSPADNSLLDTYEIDRISRQLDLYIESSHAKYYGNYQESNKDQLKVVSLTENGTKEAKIKRKNKKSRGFWLRHAAICGLSNDVVDGTSPASSGRLANHVPVVSGARCRPRPRGTRA